jgi:hypothetical protein
MLRLLAAASAILIIGASDPPSPGSGEAQSQHETDPAEKHSNPQPDQPGTPNLPFIVQIQDTPSQHSIAAKPENNSQWYANPDWWVAGFTGALVVATSGLWIFTAFLWGSTRRLVRSAEDTAERQLRAYVFIEPDQLTLALEQSGDTGTLAVRYVTTNTGQTPAHEISGLSELRIMPHPLPTDFVIKTPEIGEEHKHPFTLGPHDKFFGGPTTQYRRLNNDEGYYLLVIVTYRDAFGKPRTTKFCCFIDVQALRSSMTRGTVKTIDELRFSIVGNHNDAN